MEAAGAEWGSILEWTRRPDASWFHASNLNRGRFHELARAAGVSEQEINRVFDQDTPARLRQDGASATIVLQIPRAPSPTARRSCAAPA
jgi:hypothetical protein